MTREEFCARVDGCLDRASRRERQAIRAELAAHMEDHAQALEEAGYAANEAMEQAVEAMGEPEEIGKALNSQLSIFWQVMIWVGTLLIVLVCVLTLESAYTRYWSIYTRNSMARREPYSSKAPGEEYSLCQDLEIRAPIGNDELYVYWVGIDPEKNEASVTMCLYDQAPFGYVSRSALHSVWLENQAGETFEYASGSTNMAVADRRFDSIPVEPTDTHLILRYEQYGEDLTLEVPLPWEVRE